MKLIMLGAHQRATPVAQLEHFMFSAESLPQALQELRHHVVEGMLISTCNRVEVYALVPDIDLGVQAVEDFLTAWYTRSMAREMSTDIRQLYSTCYTEDEVVQHIFRLAAGLDSLVLGDDQIMGQIKAALAAAHAAGASGKVLHRLIHQALANGKLVRTETRIASQPVSVISVALDQAHRHLGNLGQYRCLVIGAGHMAQLALKLLSAKYAPKLSVINRTYEHAAALAVQYHAKAWPFEAMEQAMAEHDVILCATAASQFVVSQTMIERTVGKTPRLFLDLSVPRGLDPVGIKNSHDDLVDVDALQSISAENHAARAAEIAHAETLIEPAVQGFMAWRAEQAVVPAIRDLKAYAEQIRIAELRRALAHLPSLTVEEEQVIQALTTAIINKLLHQPIMALKDPESGLETAQTLTRVFQLSQTPQTNQEAEVTEVTQEVNEQ